MTHRNILLLALNLILVMTVGYLYFQGRPSKNAYFLNQKVFEQSSARQELETKLSTVTINHQKQLDSLLRLTEQGMDSSYAWQLYEETARKYALREQELTEKYTVDLWQQINGYVDDYGKEKGYDFIFGATGNGSLMYAREAYDITDEIIDYINLRYEGGE